MRTRTPQEVVARLERFAARRGPDGLARAMRLFGIKGQMNHGARCPIARYLWRRVPEATGVNATRWLTAHQCRHVLFDVETPEPLLIFMARFDDAGYPDLVEQDPYAR